MQKIHKNGFKEFKPDYLEDKLFKSKKIIDAVQLERFSLEERFEKDMKKGKTFLINDPEFQRQGKRTHGGIFSPSFGADLLNRDNSALYSCQCQNPTLMKAIHAGTICPLCGTKVSFIETDLSKVAFIDISPYHVLTNTGVKAFKTEMKIKVIEDVITRNPKITLKGHREKQPGEVSLIDLYDDYDELYAEKVGFLKEDIFTSKIPVFSSGQRPLIQNGINIIHFDVNKYYLSIVALQNNLKDVVFSKGTDVEAIRILNKIQDFSSKVENEVDELFNGKAGKFRRDIAASRINYVSRMVITLDDTLRCHEIILPYTAFMIKYEEEIVREIKKLKDCSMKDALSEYYASINFVTPIAKRAINVLLEKGKGIWTFINRNPTIALGSFLEVKVKSINFDLNDKTMYLSPDILPLMNADFDGDQLSCVVLKFEELVNCYMPFFRPTYMIINRADGFFNPSLGLKKDHAAIISCISEISRKINAHANHGFSNQSIIEDLRRFGFMNTSADYYSENDLSAMLEESASSIGTTSKH